jgi:hypothetical protein
MAIEFSYYFSKNPEQILAIKTMRFKIVFYHVSKANVKKKQMQMLLQICEKIPYIFVTIK